jgi:CyaY protein
MNDKEFALEVSRIINFIAETIEENDPDGDIDVDINGDILNIVTNDGVFVINRQPSLKEIWLSSPISGPYHFAYDGKKWRSSAGYELFLILSQDLQMSLGEG